MLSESKKSRIMIVDDSAEDIHILLNLLKEEYQVTVSKNGEAALKQLEQNEHPHLILMDVNMPGLNGYETCKLIKENTELQNIDVLFLSAHDSTQEVLQGYGAGGVDYIVKPYIPEVLYQKIQIALTNQEKQRQLAEAASAAHEVAMLAMSDTGMLGSIIQFLRESFKIDNEGKLVDLLCSSISDFGLNTTIYIECDGRKYCRTDSGEDPTMLELDLLERLIGHNDPIVDTGTKIALTHSNISLLIKKPPQDKSRISGIKDNLMILLEGANAKIEYFVNISRNAVIREQKANQIILEAEQILSELQLNQKKHKQQSVTLFDKMVTEIELSFASMDLTEAQENKLLVILHKTSKKALDHFEQGLKLDDRIVDVVNSLSAIARK